MAGAVGGFIVTQLGLFGSAAGALTTAGAIAAVGINTALYLGLNAVTNRLLRPKAGQFAPMDRVIRSGSQPKIIVYGEVPVGGVLAYQNSKKISGSNNWEMWSCIVCAGHEVEDITDVYFDDDELDSGGAITWSSNQATVDSGPWYADDATHEASTLYKFLGTDTQTLPTAFTSAFSDLDSNFRLRGYSGLICKWQVFDESEEIFKNGEPANVRMKTRGRKVYDPRLDTSPGANPDNTSYFAWTQNPVLIAVDYLRNYWRRGGIPAARFDWDHIDAQADLCDVTVSTPDGNQSRYTCNGALSLGDSGNANLARILDCCLGRRSTVNGLIRITVGDDVASSVSLDESDIIGSLTVRTSMPKEERFNTVNGTYLGEDYGYNEIEFQPVTDAGFVSRDNGIEIPRPVVFSMVTNEYQAQRLAFKMLQQSDQPTTVEVPLKWSGMRLTPGTYCSLTYDKFGWSSKLFRCTSLKIGERGVPVTAVLREDSAAAWDDPTSPGDYTTKNADGTITPPTTEVPAPTGLSATATLEGILVEWTNPVGRANWDYVDVYASATSAWSGASRVATGIRNERFQHALGEVTRYYWARAVLRGVESNRIPNSNTSTVSATVGAAVQPGATVEAVTVTVDPPGLVWDTYEAGGWSPADTTRSVTVKFWRGSTELASRILDATLDDSGVDEGDIGVVAGTSTGDATSVSLSGNNTAAVLATVTHDDSGVQAFVSFGSSLPGYSGGVTK